jgi:hypothetical protein
MYVSRNSHEALIKFIALTLDVFPLDIVQRDLRHDAHLLTRSSDGRFQSSRADLERSWEEQRFVMAAAFSASSSGGAWARLKGIGRLVIALALRATYQYRHQYRRRGTEVRYS